MRKNKSKKKRSKEQGVNRCCHPCSGGSSTSLLPGTQSKMRPVLLSSHAPQHLQGARATASAWFCAGNSKTPRTVSLHIFISNVKHNAKYYMSVNFH